MNSVEHMLRRLLCDEHSAASNAPADTRIGPILTININ